VLLNIGRGPAFVRKAFLSGGVANIAASTIIPTIVAPSNDVHVTFLLTPTDDAARSITQAITQGADLNMTALYHDISRGAAWRSKARLTQLKDFWKLTDVEVSEIELRLLD
jgi:hypothetical protein